MKIPEFNKLSLSDLGCWSSAIADELRRRGQQESDPFASIKGNEAPKRAILVAAIQKHTVFVFGPANVGKSMLCQAAASVGVPTIEATCCPCGNYMNVYKACRCSASRIEKHLNKIRPQARLAEIHIEVSTVPAREMLSTRLGTSLPLLREWLSGALPINEVGTTFDEPCNQIMKQAVTEIGLDARSVDHVREVSRSCAALGHSKAIRLEDVCEAIAYRRLGRLPDGRTCLQC